VNIEGPELAGAANLFSGGANLGPPLAMPPRGPPRVGPPLPLGPGGPPPLP
jgi:hypothetical protein